MRKIICLIAIVIAAAAFAPKSSATEDQRDRLRREIAERARELRALRDNAAAPNQPLGSGKTNTQQSGTTSNPFSLNDVFGKPVNLWEQGIGAPTTAQPQAGTKKKAPAKPQQSVDLNGRPMTSIQQRPATAPGAKTGAAPAAAPAAKAAVVESAAPQITAAQTLFDNGEYGSARQMLIPIASSRIRAANEVTAAKNIIDKIDALSKKLMADAAALMTEGKPEQAAKIYNQVVTSFSGSPDSIIAAAKIYLMKASPEDGANYLLEQVRANLDKNRLDVSLPLLQELTALYPNSPQAASAQELLKQLQAQQAASKLSEDQVMTARKYLMVGDIHALNGRTDEAIENYNRVIRDFEDTRFAEQAREKLATITEKNDK